MSLYEDEKNLKSIEKRIKNASYSAVDKKLLFSYEAELFVRDLCVARVLKHLGQLHRFRIWLGVNFQEATERDLKTLVSQIQRRNDLAASTKNDYKRCIRQFYQWLSQDDAPSIVNWIDVKRKIGNSILPEELITEDEVSEMIGAANNLRDKAFIATLYETGARIGEMDSLQIKNIRFDELGAVLMVNGKTGMRRVRVVSCVPYLSSWFNMHPHKDDPDSPLWVGIGSRGYGKPLKYATYRQIVKRVARRAGIKKRIYLHLFRHSRCTELAKHLTEAQLEGYVGWVNGSDMASTYIHLSGKEIDDAILKMYGKGIEVPEPPISSRECPRCGTINEATHKICKKCGLAFDIKDAIEKDEMSDEFISNLAKLAKMSPDFESLLADYLKKYGE